MDDLPAGPWSQLLVGHQWPSAAAVARLEYWRAGRDYVGAGHEFLADSLRDAQTGALAAQQGATADALLDAFGDGERLARRVAAKNRGKAGDHAAVLRSVAALRDELAEIAQRGNREIDDIEISAAPAALKAPRILAVIAAGQQQANVAAAKCAADIAGAGQRILDREAAGESFRRFARANGIDMGELFRSRNLDDVAVAAAERSARLGR